MTAEIPPSRPTENRHPGTLDIDLRPTSEVVEMICAQDAVAVTAVAAQRDSIAQAVDLAVSAIESGGRVHYAGAGTSGRLAVLDAAELGPTYGVGEEWFVAHLAGGREAMFRSSEGTEDERAQGRGDVAPLTGADLVVGLAASGRTPYVAGALEHAREVGAATALITSDPDAELGSLADVVIAADTGPEVIAGSTRMKAGTAQKMILTAFSTATMVRLGRTYSNLMIDVHATNSKLRARQVRILVEATGAERQEAERALTACGGQARPALVCLATGADPARSWAALADGRRLREVIRALTDGEALG